MFYMLAVAAIAVMRLYPATPTARFLHRWLAERPVVMLDRIERRHVIFLMITIGAALLLREAAPMLASATDLALFGIWDASVFIDVAIAAWTIAALGRSRAGWSVMRQRVVRLFSAGRPRSPRARARRTRAVRPVANDDDGDGLAFAA